MICEPFLSSSTVEHAAVNRGVVGSSPTWGAKKKPVNIKFAGFRYVWHFRGEAPFSLKFGRTLIDNLKY
jgi:hypothetical protein